MAVRSDAKRCKKCHSKRREDHRKSDRGKRLRAENYRLLRESIIDGYGGKCECCGEKTKEFLSIDHVNGGGRKERETLSIYQIMRKIINANFPNDYRVLCHNCNSSLGFYGYCPHKKRTS